MLSLILRKQKKTALKELKSNKDIVIKPADKGGAIVILDKQFYEAEGFRQLTNPKYYREITAPLEGHTLPELTISYTGYTINE